MHRSLLAAGMVLILASTAEAQWRTYENERYGYRLHVPPGAEQPVLSDSGDGVTYSVEHGQLRVHGTIVMGRAFEEEARGRLDAAVADGWRVNYKNIEPRTATFDMSGDGIIHYVHGIEICDGAAAFFEYDYHRWDVKLLRPIFKHMAASLQATGACAGDVARIRYPTD